MFGITDLGVFVAGTIAIVLLPGPNSLYVLTVAARAGIARGYAGAAGVFTGDLILMLVTILGAASLLQSHPVVFNVIKWAGAVYLAWLGLKLVWGGIKAWQKAKTFTCAVGDLTQPIRTVAEHSTGAIYRRALVISLLNPKAIFFFISFFIQFANPSYPYPSLTFAVLGAIVQASSMIYLSIVIVGGAKLARVFSKRKRLSAMMSAAIGALFIVFGLRLAG